ncbi:hypothetical protein O3S80_40320 [Streptomyces sp. Lzd4kr]|nr:hypothetical protein [Streptomyces sp. Lzd4kr]
MFQRIPTVLWIVGATLAIGALTPVVGQVATSAPPPAPAASAPLTEETASPEPVPSGPAASARPSGSASSPSSAERQSVIKAVDTRLGPTAADDEGFTLYRSDLDGNDPPVSVCNSAKCVQAWKPVYLPDGRTEPVAGPGIDPARVGSVRRADGTWQATLGGWPLYRYAKDTAPGDVAGEGLKGTWHASAPDGTRAGADQP